MSSKEGASTAVTRVAKFPLPGIVLAHFIVSDDVERSRRFYTDVLGGETCPSQIENDVVAGHRAADERASLGGRFHRVWAVVDMSRNQRRLAGVADAGPA
jgi:hypothetical protein